MIQTAIIGDDEYFIIDSEEELEQWVKEGGWTDLAHFEESLSITREEVIGHPFLILGDRVFIN